MHDLKLKDPLTREGESDKQFALACRRWNETLLKLKAVKGKPFQLTEEDEDDGKNY